MQDADSRPDPQDQDAFEKIERAALKKGRAPKRAKAKRRRAKAAPKAAAAVDGPKLALLSVETTPDPAPADATQAPDLAVVGGVGGNISRNPRGLETALKGLGLSLRYNLRSARAEWRGRAISHLQDNVVWSAANDRVDSFIRETIAEKFQTGPKEPTGEVRTRDVER